jgi:N-acetylmuramoyl-L-alanine amidase
VNGLGVEELAAANGLPADALLVSGATIQIPPAASVPTGTGVSGTGACVWHCGSTVHPHPTDEVVSSGAVAEEASKYEMSPSLVQSIGWEESGFNNSVVSPASARGVMQIIPDTWDFVNEQLTDTPLSSVSALSNVEAGTIYLHHLYHLMGGDREATIAAYFQGPNRDRLLPETQNYLSKVLQTKAELEAGGG